MKLPIENMNRLQCKKMPRLLYTVLAIFCSGIFQISNAQISISFTGTSPSCSNYTDGNVQASATGGQQPYQYHWSTGSNYHTLYVGAGTYTVTVTDNLGQTATDTYTLTAPAPLTAPVLPTVSACEGTDGSYVCNPTGGTPPYNYAWNTGDTDNEVVNPPSGYLSVTITDANGCMKVGGTNVREPMTVEVQVVDVVCPMLCDGSVEAVITGGVGPFTFLWSNGATTQVVFPLPPGNYTVTVTDANGCTAEATGNVYEPPPIEITFDIQNACSGNTSVTASATGGTPPFTYEWSNDETGPTITGISDGVYFVTVTDANNCKKTANVLISPGNLALTVITEDATCTGIEDGSAVIYVSGGVGPYTYAWNNGYNTNIGQNLSAGNYVVTVTDIAGCTGTEDFVIANVQAVNIALSTTGDGCIDANSGTASAVVTGGTSPYTFQWSNSNDNDPFVNGLDAGNYSLTVTDAAGCLGINNFTVENIPVLSLNLSATSANCSTASNGTASVLVSGGLAPYTYNWSIGNSTTPAIIGLPQGACSVTVTDLAGCSEVASVEITSANEIPIVSITTTESGCNDINNGTATANVSGGVTPYSYSWSNSGPSQQFIDNLVPGNYSVTVTDNLGCSNIASQVVGTATPFSLNTVVSDASCQNTSDGSATVTLNGIAPDPVYQWSNNAPSNPIATGLQPGDYAVTVSASNGCTALASINIGAVTNMTLSLTTDDAGCNNANDGSATVQISGGSTPYVITWNDPAAQNTGTALNLSPGQYSVSVLEAGGCISTADVQVTEAMPFSLSSSISNASCQNIADGAVAISIVGDFTAPLEIQWDAPGLNGLSGQGLLPGDYAVTVTDANLCSAQSLLTVAPASVIDAVIGYDVVACNGNTVEVAFVDNSASSSNVQTWQWIVNGSVVSDISAFSMSFSEVPLNIELIVTNSANCVDDASALLDINPVSIDINAIQESLCTGSDVQMTVLTEPNDILTWNWNVTGAIIDNTAISNPLITFENDGTAMIQVTATNQDGCVGTDQISVNIQDTLFGFEPALVTTVQSCDDYTVTFSNNNTTTASFSWIFGDPDNPLGTSQENSPVFTFPGSGVQPVTIVPEGACLSPVSFEVNLTPPAEASFSVDLENCTAPVLVTFSGNANEIPISWNWNFGAAGSATNQNPELIIDESQTINASLIANFSNGCADTVLQSVPVSVFDPELPSAAIDICAGVSTGINPDFDPDLSYSWSPGGSTEPNPIISPAISTEYIVTISDGSGCQTIATVSVNVPPPVALSVSADVIACDSDPETISATSSNAVSFVWSNEPDFTPVLGQTGSLVIIPGDPATYYVQATDQYGCTNSEQVTAGAYPLEYLLSPDDTVCAGRTAEIFFQNLNPDQNLDLNWEPFDPTNMPITLDNTFSLSITNQYGCGETAEVAIAVGDMSLTVNAFADPDTIQKGQSSQIFSTFNEKYTYLWTPATFLSDPNIHNPVAKPEETTTYCVNVTDDFGCEVERCVTIVVVTPPCQEPNIYFPNAFTPDGDGLNDILYLYGSQVDEVHFVIYNRWGEKVYESFAQADGWDGTHKGQPLGPDVYGYYLEVKCAGGDEFFKKGNVTVLK